MLGVHAEEWATTQDLVQRIMTERGFEHIPAARSGEFYWKRKAASGKRKRRGQKRSEKPERNH
jgi:hypothetical protein